MGGRTFLGGEPGGGSEGKMQSRLLSPPTWHQCPWALGVPAMGACASVSLRVGGEAPASCSCEGEALVCRAPLWLRLLPSFMRGSHPALTGGWGWGEEKRPVGSSSGQRGGQGRRLRGAAFPPGHGLPVHNGCLPRGGLPCPLHQAGLGPSPQEATPPSGLKGPAPAGSHQLTPQNQRALEGPEASLAGTYLGSGRKVLSCLAWRLGPWPEMASRVG